MSIDYRGLMVATIALLLTANAEATLPTVGSANLVAHFQANEASLGLDASGNVLSWTAENNAGITLEVGGSNDPDNIRFNPSGLGSLGAIEVRDYSGDNRYLRGSLGTGLNGATIFWVGYYDPGRDGSLGDGSGQYAYSIGRALGQGTQIDHQIDDDSFELYGGAGTQAGLPIDYLNGHNSVWQTNYFPTAPGHKAFANGYDLGIPADGGYKVSASGDLLLFGWQNSAGTASGFNFVGNMSDLVIYDGVLDAADAASVASYLNDRLPTAPPDPPNPPEPVTLFTSLSGLPNSKVSGFVPHGNSAVTGTAEFRIYPNNTMDYQILVDGNAYPVTQAHFYNINKTSGTSGDPAHGDSIICWGGRWANGGDSDEYLQGTGYVNGRLVEVLENPEDWMLIVHTAGGHFANDPSGELVEYDRLVHETNELGVPENERSTRFNNRVGRTLLDMTLREDNARDRSAPFYDPNDPANVVTEPYADGNGVRWVEFDEDSQQYVLTADALAMGYDLETEYLFYLYDDQGPTWDFGGPEGAFGGFLRTRIAGDLNNDGSIDGGDFLLWQRHNGSTGNTPYSFGDGDGDGDTDSEDLALWQTQYGVPASSQGAVGNATSVPEPTAGVLLLGMCFCAMAVRDGRLLLA